MFPDEELGAYRELRFVLECSEIRLRQLGTKRPRILRGPGKIYQGPDGRLHYEVYVTRGKPSTPGAAPLGETLPRAYYYSLTAVDYQGRKWRCQQTAPSASKQNYSTGFHLLRGDIRLLVHNRRVARRDIKHSVTGYVFSRDVSVRANQRTTYRTTRGAGSWSAGSAWDVAKFTVGDADVLFEHDPGQVMVRASRPDTAFPAAYGQRMLEALRFVTGTLASWSVLIVSGPGRFEVNLSRIDRRLVSISPPIPKNTTVSAAATERMFACYLTYVLKEERPLWFHRLSAEWGEVLRAGQGTLQTQAPIWCIVADSLLSQVRASRRLGAIVNPTEKAQLKRWRSRVLKHLQDKNCPKSVLDRFHGVTGRMLEPRSKDIIKRLHAVGAVDGRLERRWSKLRNTTAHADRDGQSDADSLFVESMAVLSLLYQLSFYLIGYEGWFQDFGAKGWPLREYPLNRQYSSTLAVSQDERGLSGNQQP